MTGKPTACSMEYLLEAYGEDALQPCRIAGDEEDEVIVVPRMRERMTVEEWFALPQEFRLFVLKAFYENL